MIRDIAEKHLWDWISGVFIDLGLFYKLGNEVLFILNYVQKSHSRIYEINR